MINLQCNLKIDRLIQYDKSLKQNTLKYNSWEKI